MRRLLPLLIALPTLAPATASAWTAPVKTPLPRAGELQAGLAGDGSAVVASRSERQLAVTVRPSGGSFAPAQELGFARDSPFDSTWRLAVGATGRAMLIWQSEHNEIHAALREPGATSFATQRVTHGEPNEESLDSVEFLARTVGEDGHAYLAFVDGTGATMLVADPGSTTFRRVGHVDSVIGPPWMATYGFGGLAVATDRGGTRATMLAARISTDSGQSELWAERWSVGGSAEPPVMVVREPLVFSTEGQFPERPVAGAGDYELVGVSGTRATFFMHRGQFSRTPDDTVSTYQHQLAEVDAGGDGTPSPPSVIAAVDNRQTDDSAPIISTGPDGSGLVGWAPPADQASGLARILVGTRTDPSRPLESVSPPFPATRVDDGINNPNARLLGLATTAPGSGYVMHGSGAAVAVTPIGPAAPAGPPLTLVSDANGQLGTVAGAGDGHGRAMVALNRIGKLNATSVWAVFDERPTSAPTDAAQSEPAATAPAAPATPSAAAGPTGRAGSPGPRPA